MGSMLICHKCPHAGTEKCIACTRSDENTAHKQYLLEGYDPPQPSTSGSEQVTDLPDEVEDRLRKFLFDLFDLQPLEILCLQAIMQGKSLTCWAQESSKILNKPMTRFHAFQLRKSMLSKLGAKFSAALLTTGQRRPLKKSRRKIF